MDAPVFANRRQAARRSWAPAWLRWLWVVWLGPILCVVPPPLVPGWLLQRLLRGRPPPGVPASTAQCICLPLVRVPNERAVWQIEDDSYCPELAPVMNRQEFDEFVRAFNANERERFQHGAGVTLHVTLWTVLFLVATWLLALGGTPLLWFASPTANAWLLVCAAATELAAYAWLLWTLTSSVFLVDETIGHPSLHRLVALENMRSHRKGVCRWRLRHRVDSSTHCCTWLELWPFGDPERERLEPLWNANPDMAYFVPRSLYTPSLWCFFVAFVLAGASLWIWMSAVPHLHKYTTAAEINAEFDRPDSMTVCQFYGTRDDRVTVGLKRSDLNLTLFNYIELRKEAKHQFNFTCYVTRVCMSFHLRQQIGTKNNYTWVYHRVENYITVPHCYGTKEQSIEESNSYFVLDQVVNKHVGYRRNNYNYIIDLTHIDKIIEENGWSASWRIKLLGLFLTTCIACFSLSLSGSIVLVHAGRQETWQQTNEMDNTIQTDTAGAALLMLDI